MDDDATQPEAEFARRLSTSLKIIESIVSVVSYVLIAVLGVLYYVGVLQELWVLLFPAAQQLALKMAIGGYYGAKVAPSVIEEQKRNAPSRS